MTSLVQFCWDENIYSLLIYQRQFKHVLKDLRTFFFHVLHVFFVTHPPLQAITTTSYCIIGHMMLSSLSLISTIYMQHLLVLY